MENDKLQLEENRDLQLDFQKLRKVCSLDQEFIPIVIQDIYTKEVLLLAYTNETALQQSIRQKTAVFWSTSRNQLWVKGDTSGDYLTLKEIRVNCEQNVLLYLVESKTGGVCHTKDKNGKARKTCFYRKLENSSLTFLH